MNHRDYIDPETGEVTVGQLVVAFDQVCENLVSEGIHHRREVGKLKAELGRIRVPDDDPDAERIQGLLSLWWREVKDSNPLVAHELSCSRAGGVKAALKLRAKGRGRTIETATEDCRRAILGVLHDDWATGRIHKSQGKNFCDIAKHILKDDDTIERFIGLYERHKQMAVPVPSPEPPADTEARIQRIREESQRKLKERDDRREQAVEKLNEQERIHGDRRDPITRVLSACGERETVSTDRWLTFCPCHEDTHMSCQITRGDTGTVLLKCWGCDADFGQIANAWGLDVRALWDGSERDHNRAGFVPASKRVPAHLMSAMQQLLRVDEAAA